MVAGGFCWVYPECTGRSMVATAYFWNSFTNVRPTFFALESAKGVVVRVVFTWPLVLNGRRWTAKSSERRARHRTRPRRPAETRMSSPIPFASPSVLRHPAFPYVPLPRAPRPYRRSSAYFYIGETCAGRRFFFRFYFFFFFHYFATTTTLFCRFDSLNFGRSTKVVTNFRTFYPDSSKNRVVTPQTNNSNGQQARRNNNTKKKIIYIYIKSNPISK